MAKQEVKSVFGINGIEAKKVCVEWFTVPGKKIRGPERTRKEASRFKAEIEWENEMREAGEKQEETPEKRRLQRDAVPGGPGEGREPRKEREEETGDGRSNR